MTFGEKLRQARKRSCMTQKELAEKIGAKHNSVSNWEHDQNQPDAELIGRLCKALLVEPNYFFAAEPVENQLSGVEFALFGEVRQLSEADKQDVLDFIRFKRTLRERKEPK